MTERTTYLYRIQPTRPEMLSQGSTSEEDASIDEHFAYRQALTAQGVVLFVGRTLTTTPDTFGIAVFHAENETAAREIMQQDPAVRKGVMRAELFPFKIALVGQLAD
jgi:uncharacterized protein YciI